MLPPIVSEAFAAATTLLIAVVALLGERTLKHVRFYRAARDGMREHAAELGPGCQRATLPKNGKRSFLARLDEFNVTPPHIFWHYHRVLKVLNLRWNLLYRVIPNGSHVWPENPELYNTLQLRLAAGGPARHARKAMRNWSVFDFDSCLSCGEADLAHHNYHVMAATSLWELSVLRRLLFSQRVALVGLALTSTAWLASILLRATM